MERPRGCRWPATAAAPPAAVAAAAPAPPAHPEPAPLLHPKACAGLCSLCTIALRLRSRAAQFLPDACYSPAFKRYTQGCDDPSPEAASVVLPRPAALLQQVLDQLQAGGLQLLRAPRRQPRRLLLRTHRQLGGVGGVVRGSLPLRITAVGGACC